MFTVCKQLNNTVSFRFVYAFFLLTLETGFTVVIDIY